MDTTKQMPIRVLIVDDQEVSVTAIQMLLKYRQDIVVCGEILNSRGIFKTIKRTRPNVILIDVKMPEINSVDLTIKIRRRYPHIHILAVTQYTVDESIIRMIQAGAQGFLEKFGTPERLADAINAVNDGNSFFCKDTIIRLQELVIRGSIVYKPPLPQLFFAPNEKEILLCICKGYSAKEIAAKLRLAVSSVEKYRTKLFKKTRAKNMVGLILFAVQYGIFQPTDDELYYTPVKDKAPENEN